MRPRPPCGRPLPGDGDLCQEPRAAGLQRCRWHWLAAQPPDVQEQWADRRLAAAPEPPRPRVSPALWPEGKRWCSGCQSMVPLFYVTGSRCRSCASSAQHAQRIQSTYGIPRDEYDRIFRVVQGGVCGICRRRPASIRFAVDHDHKTGEVRGVLCKRCNHDLLGAAADSLPILLRAIAYLCDPPAQRNGPPMSHQDIIEVISRVLMSSGSSPPAAAAPATAAEPPPF